MTRARGFTLVELMVTVALVAILASVVIPLGQVAAQRAQEQELRIALREIRGALDAYRAAVEQGRIYTSADASGYPPDLEVLVEGVPDLKDPKGRKIYFLRRLPRDPLHDDPSVAAADTWGKRAYASEPDDPQEGDDVYDVYSRSERKGLNGRPYREW